MTSRPQLRGRVLVTGGGFIGGRLVERLVREHDVEVVVLARRAASAERLARTGCRTVIGDVTDPAAVRAAVAGCDSVFHCAFGTSGSTRNRVRVNREGTRLVLEAAGSAGVRRVVHLSTFMVYGRTTDGTLTESSPRRPFGNSYSDSKLDAERIALDLAHSGRSPAVVLQPTNVYGPNAGVWVERVISQMRQARIPLLDGGAGICNAVYVDDLVDAMILAAAAPASDVVGEAFLVSSGEAVTWRAFYHQFEEILGEDRTVSRTAQQAREDWKRAQTARPRLTKELSTSLRERRVDRGRLLDTVEVRAARRLASTLLPEGAQDLLKRRARPGAPDTGRAEPAAATAPGSDLLLLTPEEIDFFTSRAVTCIDKAVTILGYRPAFDLDAGMAATAQWMREAAIL